MCVGVSRVCDKNISTVNGVCHQINKRKLFFDQNLLQIATLLRLRDSRYRMKVSLAKLNSFEKTVIPVKECRLHNRLRIHRSLVS